MLAVAWWSVLCPFVRNRGSGARVNKVNRAPRVTGQRLSVSLHDLRGIPRCSLDQIDASDCSKPCGTSQHFCLPIWQFTN